MRMPVIIARFWLGITSVELLVVINEYRGHIGNVDNADSFRVFFIAAVIVQTATTARARFAVRSRRRIVLQRKKS